MQVRDLITLYDYYYWATEKILAQAAQVTPAQWAGPPPVGDRSLQRTLVHTLDAERGWRYSWTGQDDFVPLQAADFPDAATLAARWREEETALRAYLGSLSDADLQGAFYDPDAPDLPLALWQVIAHVSYHGMQHRSEAAMLLTHYGRSPGGIDMVFWLFERG
ncbi:MAG: DinB family protein [Thermomicrobiales bacterium]